MTAAGRAVGWLCVATMLLAATAAGQPDSDLERRARERPAFALFNNCEPIYLATIVGVSREADEINLTDQSLEFVAETRLRVARLYTDIDADDLTTAFLWVIARVHGTGFTLSLEYQKPVVDVATGFTFRATTWEVTTGDLHYGDIGHITSRLSAMLDYLFLDDYLQANESAC